MSEGSSNTCSEVMMLVKDWLSMFYRDSAFSHFNARRRRSDLQLGIYANCRSHGNVTRCFEGAKPLAVMVTS